MTPTILLVEDEPNDAFFFEHSVKRAGLLTPVVVARDGREALDYLEGADPYRDREKHPLPWLVVLDLKLPRADGFEVLEQIRRNPKLRRLIVLVLTSSSSQVDIERAYDLGANAYLVKPSDSHELAAIVRSIKDFWLTYNQPPVAPGSSLLASFFWSAGMGEA
jgi:two-component system response regulator